MPGRVPNYERRAQMVAMHERGMTNPEIARELGCSLQNVAQILCKEGKAHFRPYSSERCIYIGLRSWLNKNRIGIAELCRRKYGRQGGNEASHFRERLCGKRTLTMYDIDFFRELTGMSYEELFKEKPADDAGKV